jgi:hypothetical protein
VNTASCPSGDVSVTAGHARPGRHCAACGDPLPAGRARRYCTPACRQDGYRRRHQPTASPAALPVRRSRRDGTVYQCDDCDQLYLAEQWCPDCNRPCRRLGSGGTCPNCEEIILLDALLATDLPDTPDRKLATDGKPNHH